MSKILFRIRDIVDEKRLSVDEFARLSSINYRTALDICNNQYRRVGLDTIAKICEALNVSPGDIFIFKPTRGE